MSCKLTQTIIQIFLFKNLARNEYPNILVSKKLTRTNIQINSFPKNDTNQYPNKYSDKKFLNIRTFEYIRHSLDWNVKSFSFFENNLDFWISGSGGDISKKKRAKLPDISKKSLLDFEILDFWIWWQYVSNEKIYRKSTFTMFISAKNTNLR